MTAKVEAMWSRIGGLDPPVPASKMSVEEREELSMSLFGSLYDPELTLEELSKSDNGSVVKMSKALMEHSTLSSSFSRLKSRVQDKPFASLRAAKSLSQSFVSNGLDFSSESWESESESEELSEEEKFASDAMSYMFGDTSDTDVASSDEKSSTMYTVSLDTATDEAEEEISNGENIVQGLFGGLGATETSFESQHRLDELQDDSKMAEFLRVLGDLRASVSSSMRTLRSRGATGTPVDVTPKRDIRSMIPIELLMLAAGGISTTRTLHRYLQGQTLCFEKEVKVPGELGPFTILLDRSYSMSLREYPNTLTNYEVALALTFASILIAASDGREVRLFVFDEEAEEIEFDVSDATGRIELATLFMTMNVTRGTCIANALKLVTEADSTLLITDGFDPSLVNADLSSLGKINVINIASQMSPDMRELKEKSESFVFVTDLASDGEGIKSAALALK